MDENVILLVGQMKIIASLMVIGFAAQRLKLFNDELINALSAMISKLILPLMLATVIGSISREELFGAWKFFVCSSMCYIVLVTLSKFGAVFMVSNEPKRSMHALLMSFGNSGFIGIPLVLSMFPDKAGAAAASFSVVEATLYWVFGPLLINNGEKKNKIDLKKIITPLTIAIFIGCIIVILNINLSNFVLWNTMKDVGGTSKYFASIYIGMNIGRMGLKKLLSNMRAFLAVPFKLVIFPILAYFMFGKTNILTGETLIMFMVLFSTPAGMALPILSNLAGFDGEYSSAGSVISTILCLVTMPFIIWLIGYI